MADPRKPDWPVCVALCAPFGQDAPTLARLFEAWGAAVRSCPSPGELAEAIRDERLTLLVFTEEALEACAAPLAAALRAQPSWSDLPLIVLSAEAARGGSGVQWEFLRQFANMTILHRPSAANLLRAAFDAGCRARAWQYTVRDQLCTLSVAAAQLEQRVQERTAQLLAEVEARKRVESALAESRKLEAIGRLTGGVAHDFNNLLQVVQGSAALLPLVKPGSEPFERALHAIGRAASRGAKLTHQLLAFGRRQTLSAGALDVARHLAEMTGLLRQSLREQIALAVHIEPGLWPADADATQLEVALLNLTVNARDAMPRGGQVAISARNLVLPSSEAPQAGELVGEFVWLAVTDSGPGMAPEVVRQAFEPFFTTKPVGSGTGLGLSQVYGFAGQSGGAAWIDTAPGRTSISILLPRSLQEPVAESSTAQAPAGAPLVGGRRVLYVEDDPEVAEATLAILANLGCESTMATGAEEALAHPLDRFDVVFSDVVMPGTMDGIDLARAIREQCPSMPILLASGYVIAPERLNGLQIGVLAKPYSQEVLRKALARLLAASGPSANRTST